MGNTVIHANPGLSHQVELAHALLEGHRALGIDCEVSHSPNTTADTHIVLGPWFAKQRWIGHPSTMLLDRALWGDPEHVTLGWMTPDGGRMLPFGVNVPRAHPEPQPWRRAEHWDNVLVLLDFGRPMPAIESMVRSCWRNVRIRHHPAECAAPRPLPDDLRWADVAVGWMSTALFDAVMAGVPSICLDYRAPVSPVCSSNLRQIRLTDRTSWIEDMAWLNWSKDELASGAALQYVYTSQKMRLPIPAAAGA